MSLGAEGKAALAQLIPLVINAFTKGRKARKVAEYISKYPELEAAYKSAREKIDAAEAAGVGCTLTAEEAQAVDAIMDATSKAAKKVKKAIA